MYYYLAHGTPAIYADGEPIRDPSGSVPMGLYTHDGHLIAKMPNAQIADIWLMPVGFDVNEDSLIESLGFERV